MHQKEHGGGIGGRHDRPDEEAFDPAQVEQNSRDGRRDCRGQQYPRRCERDRGAEHAAERREPGPQAAIEENERKGNRADRVGDAYVVELEPEGPGFACEHAHDQEHQEERRPEAHGNQARHDPGEHQEPAEQDAEADRVERPHAGQILPHSWAGRRSCTSVHSCGVTHRNA